MIKRGCSSSVAGLPQCLRPSFSAIRVGGLATATSPVGGRTEGMRAEAMAGVTRLSVGLLGTEVHRTFAARSFCYTAYCETYHVIHCHRFGVFQNGKVRFSFVKDLYTTWLFAQTF
jgi:hypothetical protein